MHEVVVAKVLYKASLKLVEITAFDTSVNRITARRDIYNPFDHGFTRWNEISYLSNNDLIDIACCQDASTAERWIFASHYVANLNIAWIRIAKCDEV